MQGPGVELVLGDQGRAAGGVEVPELAQGTQIGQVSGSKVHQAEGGEVLDAVHGDPQLAAHPA